MVDTREDILAQLLVIVAAIPGIQSAQRNNIDITEDQLPAAIVFDGDEETNADSDLTKASTMPMLSSMHPEIVIAEKSDGQVGTDLAVLRRELIRRVLTDDVLNQQLVRTRGSGNGTIRYLGCQSDCGWMRSLHGALRAQFLFKYALKPDDL